MPERRTITTSLTAAVTAPYANTILLFCRLLWTKYKIKNKKRCSTTFTKSSTQTLRIIRLDLSPGEEEESAWCHGRIKCVVVRYDDGLEDDLEAGDEFSLTKPAELCWEKLLFWLYIYIFSRWWKKQWPLLNLFSFWTVTFSGALRHFGCRCFSNFDIPG